jgi:hypothetical protein
MPEGNESRILKPKQTEQSILRIPYLLGRVLTELAVMLARASVYIICRRHLLIPCVNVAPRYISAPTDDKRLGGSDFHLCTVFCTVRTVVLVDVCGRCCVIEEFPLCGGGSTYRIYEI